MRDSKLFRNRIQTFFSYICKRGPFSIILLIMYVARRHPSGIPFSADGFRATKMPNMSPSEAMSPTAEGLSNLQESHLEESNF